MSKYIYETLLGGTDEKVSLDRRVAAMKAVRKTEEKFQEAMLMKLMKAEYEAERLGEKYKQMRIYEKELAGIKKELTAKEHNNQFCFITVSPKESVSLEEFKKAVEKSVSRNMFRDYLYVYEQRGKSTDEQGKGFHTHILVKRNLNYKPSKIAFNLKNTFKNMTNVNNPQLLNIQHIGHEFAKDKVDYITSLKTDEGKDEKQKIDVIWRQAEDLSPFYGNKDIN